MNDGTEGRGGLREVLPRDVSRDLVYWREFMQGRLTESGVLKIIYTAAKAFTVDVCVCCFRLSLV